MLTFLLVRATRGGAMMLIKTGRSTSAACVNETTHRFRGTRVHSINNLPVATFQYLRAPQVRFPATAHLPLAVFTLPQQEPQYVCLQSYWSAPRVRVICNGRSVHIQQVSCSLSPLIYEYNTPCTKPVHLTDVTSCAKTFYIRERLNGGCILGEAGCDNSGWAIAQNSIKEFNVTSQAFVYLAEIDQMDGAIMVFEYEIQSNQTAYGLAAEGTTISESVYITAGSPVLNQGTCVPIACTANQPCADANTDPDDKFTHVSCFARSLCGEVC
jgi:hypothetical protein